MKHPLVAVVVAYATGLLLAQYIHPPLPVLYGTCGFLLLLIIVLAILGARHPRPSSSSSRPWLERTGISFAGGRSALLWLLLALVGWINLTLRTSVLAPDDLRLRLGNEPALVTLRGTLAETPRAKIIQRGDREIWHAVARVRVHELQQDADVRPASGEVLVTVPEVPGADFFAGQPVEISGVAAPPPLPEAEGLFNARAYLATHGIFFQVKTDSTNDWKLREPRLTRPPLTDRFLNWAQQTLALGLPEADETLRLLWAMTLGWRTAFTGDIGEPFLQSGTMHMFAIDGLRIALVAGMIIILLRVLRIGRAWCGVIAIPAIWFYTAATGWEASAMRASVMMTIVIGGWMLKRPGDLLNSVAAAAFIMLVADPRQWLEASFQLSFGVMLVIALVLPPANRFSDALLARWLGPDPLLPEELVPAWRKTLVQYARHFARFVNLSFVAWLGALPLAAAYFHLFSPVSTPANVLAVPLGTGALMANMGALICGHWLPWATVLFNHAAWFLMRSMTWVSVAAARLPGAYWYTPEPSLASQMVYYGTIIVIFSGWLKTTRRKIAGGITLVLIGSAAFWRWESARAETDLTVLPLNGGAAVYVDAAGRRNDWLINCGSEDAVEFTLKEYLRAHGVNFLPRLALADGNTRNGGGAARLDELFGIGELWTSGVESRAAKAALRKLTSRRPPGWVHTLNSGDIQGCWQALFPAATNSAARTGDAALVLRGDFPGLRVLWLSELSRAGQSELLAQTRDLRAEVVIVGLPEAGEPLCDALLAAIQPRVVIIADSEFPASRRASRTLQARLARANATVIYTRAAGAAKLEITPKGWRLRTSLGAVPFPD